MKNRRKCNLIKFFIDMDNLQFDLGDEWYSMMLNDSDTSVFGEENKLGDSSPRFINKHHMHNFFRSPSTITTPSVESLEISDNAAINVRNGSSTLCISGAPSNSCSIRFRLDYCH